MADEIFMVSLIVAAICAALVAGVFLAFSDFVMRSLGSVQPEAGIEAMQTINRTVFSSLFMVLLVGSAPMAIAIAIYALAAIQGPAVVWLVAGSLIYVGGVMAVTKLRNIPMNEELDRHDHRSAAAHFYWRTYSKTWTGWNHVRWVASATAAAFYLIGAFALDRAL